MANITLTGGYDSMPVKTATLTAAQAAGVITCSNTSHQVTAASSYKVNLPYFLPTGGTGQCSNGAAGSINLYYGGMASPYTDNYATDPLFTTSLTQGMADRRSPGNAFKLQATFTSDDKRFVSYILASVVRLRHPGDLSGNQRNRLRRAVLNHSTRCRKDR